MIGYKYLPVLKADAIKDRAMANIVSKEYYRGVRRKSKLSKINDIPAQESYIPQCRIN